MFRDVSPEGPDWGSWSGPADRGSQPKRKRRHSDDSGVQVADAAPGKDRGLTASPILVQAFQFVQTFMCAARRQQACGSQSISHLFQNQVFKRNLGWVRSGSKLLGVGDLSIPANAKLYDGLPPDEQLRLFDQAVVALQETPSSLVPRNPDPASIRPQPFRPRADRSFGLASSPSQFSGVSSER